MNAAAHSTSSPGAGVPRGIWFAVVAPPIAWSLQGGVSWLVADALCGVGISAAHPRAAAARLAIGLLTIVALAVSAAAIWRVHGAWRFLREPDPSGPLAGAEATRRFLAVAGLLTSATLTLGLVLAGVPALALSACGVAR